MKTCSVCQIEKEVTEFRFRSEKNSYMTYCKSCEREKNKKYKKENKEKVSAYNIEYMKIYNVDYYQNNKSNLINYQATYRENNSDKIKARDKIYYSLNKKEILEYQKIYKQERRKLEPEFKLKEAVSAYVRSVIKKNGKSINKYLPYTILDLKNHFESQFESWMNWNNYGTYVLKTWDDNDQSTWTWQIDHIIPHSTFNYTSMEDDSFKTCWSLDNLRPYSSKQNLLDGNRR